MTARDMKIIPVLLGMIAALGCATIAGAAKEEVPLDAAKIFFEENATDGDLGLQFFLDGDGWSRLTIYTPDKRKLVDIRVSGNLGQIGLTELFSESEEPSFDELPRDEFIALFPAGVYRLVGKTVDGEVLVGEATLTHTLPAAPVITAPVEDEVVNPNALVIRWNSVPDPDPPASVITGYQIIVEKDHPGEPELALSADMPPTATSLTVPVEFLEPGKGYKVEVIAIESSGNKTIAEVPFDIAGP